jgi:hypothetical protein
MRRLCRRALRGRYRQPLGHQLRSCHRDGDFGDRFRFALQVLVDKAVDGVGCGQHDGFARRRGGRDFTDCLQHEWIGVRAVCHRMRRRTGFRAHVVDGIAEHSVGDADRHRRQIQLQERGPVPKSGVVGYRDDLSGMNLDVGEPGATAGGRALTEIYVRL